MKGKQLLLCVGNINMYALPKSDSMDWSEGDVHVKMSDNIIMLGYNG